MYEPNLDQVLNAVRQGTMRAGAKNTYAANEADSGRPHSAYSFQDYARVRFGLSVDARTKPNPQPQNTGRSGSRSRRYFLSLLTYPHDSSVLIIHLL